MTAEHVTKKSHILSTTIFVLPIIPVIFVLLMAVPETLSIDSAVKTISRILFIAGPTIPLFFIKKMTSVKVSWVAQISMVILNICLFIVGVPVLEFLRYAYKNADSQGQVPIFGDVYTAMIQVPLVYIILAFLLLITTGIVLVKESMFDYSAPRGENERFSELTENDSGDAEGNELPDGNDSPDITQPPVDTDISKLNRETEDSPAAETVAADINDDFVSDDHGDDAAVDENSTDVSTETSPAEDPSSADKPETENQPETESDHEAAPNEPEVEDSADETEQELTEKEPREKKDRTSAPTIGDLLEDRLPETKEELDGK